jgi:hypothetical protein
MEAPGPGFVPWSATGPAAARADHQGQHPCTNGQIHREPATHTLSLNPNGGPV